MADAYNIFGFEIKRKKKEEDKGSVIPPPINDGSALVNAASYYGLVLDVDGTASLKNEMQLIRQYRESSQYADCDTAIDNIVSEAIVYDPNSPSVTIVVDDIKTSETIKNKIRDEFDNVLDLYKFGEKGYDLFRQWYIDGRLYFHIILDENSPKKGIKELRFVDPRKIRKIKNVKRERNNKGIDVIKQIDEYFLYNDKGFAKEITAGVKLSVDSVIMATSGLIDSNTGLVLSYLHKAIKPVNQLKMMEDALVIYRITRAPERRIFYIDVGNLPKQRAEHYVTEMMQRFRNKIVYDATTGEIRDNRKHLSMMEDFWMPRRENGKGTEITTLPGGQNLGDIEDVQYFQRKLLQSLGVPVARLQAGTEGTNFSVGRTNEITRDEVRFSKFIVRLRQKFSVIFKDALRVQLITKNIIRPDEWDDIEGNIRFDYQEDNYYAELKETEILQTRLQTLQNIEGYIGRFYSENWVRKNILMQTEDDIAAIDKENQQLKPQEEGEAPPVEGAQ